jgi:hypothetical protein
VENSDAGTSSVEMRKEFYLNQAATYELLGPQNVFDFHEISFTFNVNGTGDMNVTIEAFVDSNLLATFADRDGIANFTITSAGYSKKSGNSTTNGVVVQFESVKSEL